MQRSSVEACSECKSTSSALRRGLCRACYLRQWRGAALPRGARCALCSEQRKTVLRWTQLGDGRVVTCQNCGFLADRARPKPTTLADLESKLARERRENERRRNYVIDASDPAERRLSRPRRKRRAATSAR